MPDKAILFLLVCAMSSQSLKSVFSNPKTSSIFLSQSLFTRERNFTTSSSSFVAAVYKQQLFSLYQISIFQVKKMKSKRLSHTLKVMRLRSDLEVRAGLQTQECLAQKPGSMFSLLLLGSPRRRAHRWKCPYRVSFKAPPPPRFCMLHGSQFLVQRI